MWVGKNNLCAVGVLSATIEYNVLRLGEEDDLTAQNCLPPQMFLENTTVQ